MANNDKTKYITVHPNVSKLIEMLPLYFMIILYGGRDSGKTVAMVHLLVALAISGNHKMAVFRAEEAQLEKESIRSMIVNEIYRLGLHVFCKRIGRRILINNKIEITVNGFHSIINFDFVGNNPEKLRGTYDGYDIFTFEEFHQFPRRVLEVAIPTLERAPNNPHLFGTCNLEDQDTYAYELLKLGGMEKEEQGWQQMVKELYNGDISEAVYPHFGNGVEMLYDTNPYLTKFAKQRITSLKHSNYEEYLVLYRNHPRTLKDVVIIRNWKLLKRPIDVSFDSSGDSWFAAQQIKVDDKTIIDLTSSMKVHMKYGQDYGFNHFFVNYEGCYFLNEEWDDFEQKMVNKRYIYIHRVVMERYLDNMLIIPRIIDRMPEQVRYQKLAYGDCARNDLIFNLNNGFLGNLPSLKVKACYKWTDQNSKPDSKGAELDGIGFLKSCTILINPHCQKNPETGELHCEDVLTQVKNFRWKPKSKTDPTPTDVVVDADNDLWDAIRYGHEDDIQGHSGEVAEFDDSFWDMQREELNNVDTFF